MEEEKKRNGPTNARTCTSVVQAHRGADNLIRRLYPQRRSSVCDNSGFTLHSSTVIFQCLFMYIIIIMLMGVEYM